MIFLIIFFGLILRLISLNQSLWLDEATTALVAKMSFSDIFLKFLPGDFHPPLYYLLMKFWVYVFGSSEISLRAPSVIFGIGTVYFVFLITQKLFNKKTGLIASTLSATSGLLIYYSQEARMYSMAAFLVSLSFYLFLKKKWIWFTAALVLLGMTDYVALLVIPVFLIFSKENRRKMLLCLLPTILTFVLWAPVLWSQISAGLSQKGNMWWNILGQLSIKNLGLIPIKFMLGRIGFDNKFLYASVVLVTFIVFGFLIIRAGSKARLIWVWLTAPLLAGILISLKIPILYYFRFLFCLPAFYILIAYGITAFSGKVFWTLLITAIGINIVSSMLYLLNPKFQREDWRGISRLMGSSVIIYPSDSQKEALIYYGKGSQIVYFKNFAGGERSLWLSRYVWQLSDPSDSARIKIEGLGYNKIQEVNANGVEFWKYSRNENRN